MPKKMGNRAFARLLFPGVALLFPALQVGCDAIRFPNPDVQYIAFGDSTTAGPADRDYHDVLRERLGESSETFANEGEGGEDTEAGLKRLRELIGRNLFPNAEYFFYWQGGADVIDFIKRRDPLLTQSPDDPSYPFATSLKNTLDSTQSNVETALALGQAEGWQVFAATYFAVSDDVNSCPALPLNVIIPSQASNANEYLNLLNDRIRSAASKQGATVVDVATWNMVLRSEPDGYFNCNHLSDSGNAIVGQVFFEAISGSGN